MPERFLTAPRSPLVVRIAAIAVGVVVLALATRTTVTSLAWVGRVFPGFFLAGDRLVASVGLPHWPGSRVPTLHHSEIVALDGVPVASTADVYARVAALPPATPVRYSLRGPGADRDVLIATQRFERADWLMIFGAYLFNGLVTLVSGLMVWALRPSLPVARAYLFFAVTAAVFLFAAMDVYGPGTFSRLFFAADALIPAAAFGFTMLFPQPHRLAHWRFPALGLGLVVAALFQVSLHDPAILSFLTDFDMCALGLVGLGFAARLVSEYRAGRSKLARQRIRVVTLGALVGFGTSAVILLSSAVIGSHVGMNLAALTPFLFVLSVSYAIVKHDLFEIDAMIKHAAFYLILTGAVAVVYVVALVLVDRVLEAQAFTASPLFPLVFALLTLLMFNPLRVRLQSLVDRAFFGQRYDSAHQLAELGARLASARDHEEIARTVLRCIDETIPNLRTRLFVGSVAQGLATERGGVGRAPRELATALAPGRILTIFDPPEAYADAGSCERVQASLARLDAEVAVPLFAAGEAIGLLTAGRKRSGLFYTAGDAHFLGAVAHQTSLALQSASSYQAVVELNTRLDERVRERTAQLEKANGDLTRTYEELQTTQLELLQSEKMASLGRLVAGVAHEINNPVSFIATSVEPLRERLERAAEAPEEEAARLLREAKELVQIMGRGAERTAEIVKNLRSFSRLDEARRKPSDLHEGLEVTLRLLCSGWDGRVEIHREYGDLPLVDCDAGQINQVLMNLLANAGDAIAEQGGIWIKTWATASSVVVEIRDDGRGIPPEARERLFEPFFTTKDVGEGTGLGLAISHGIVTAHGGRIEVESEAGGGAVFRVVLPRRGSLSGRRSEAVN
jgi:signal transduction histidine kinase